MIAHRDDPTVRTHEMNLYARYFELIATGSKTIEVRVNDSSRRQITLAR